MPAHNKGQNPFRFQEVSVGGAPPRFTVFRIRNGTQSCLCFGLGCSDKSWLKLQKDTNDGQIHINCSTNPDLSSRTATITVSANGLNNVVILATQQGTTSITENKKLKYKIFPVPATDYVVLELLVKANHDQPFILYDMNGKEHPVSFTKQGNVLMLSLKDLAKGIYIVKIIGDVNYYGKIVKE